MASNLYPHAILKICQAFPGSTHIQYTYRWINKFTGATYDALPASADIADYKQQRCIELKGITHWEDYKTES